MNKLFSIALITLAFASCQNTGDRKATPVAPTAPVSTMPAAPATTNAGTVINTTTTNSATAAANPEHGAPGHRCDIPVGAPLNGAASSTPAPANNIAPVTLQPQLPATPATNSNARLNPAHGEPGHNCAVPVGSPL
jgi:hypothetical protein